MSDESSAGVGRVVGHEMAVVCPYCYYPTEVGEASHERPIVCGEDAPGQDNHGCGRELEVIVRGAE